MSRAAKMLSSLSVLLAAVAFSGEPKEQNTLTVSEADLQRVERTALRQFAWQKARTPKPLTPAATGEGLLDISTGEIIIRAYGDFTREEQRVQGATGQTEVKELLTMSKDVEIEQLQAQFVLRAQKIRISRDVKTGQTDRLEAHGKVEIFSPERSGRGESLVYDTRYGPSGETLKNQYTIEGGPDSRATLWQGKDWIEAEKFVSDQRLGTFRVLGKPLALVTLPGSAEPAKRDSGALVPGLGTLSGKMRIQADGEIFYESSTGRIRVARNVLMVQEGVPEKVQMKLAADEVIIHLLLPPPGQPGTSSTSMFSGTLKSMECLGRVEMKAGATTLVFDKGLLDMQRGTFSMEMKNGKEEVKLYTAEGTEGGTVLSYPKKVSVDLNTNEIEAGGPAHRSTFAGAPPSVRTKEK